MSIGPVPGRATSDELSPLPNPAHPAFVGLGSAPPSNADLTKESLRAPEI